MSDAVAQLTGWTIGRVGATSQYRLYLKCRNEIATQVERGLGSALRPRIRLSPGDWDEWTHRYPLTQELSESETDFLDSMTRVLTLLMERPIALAIALDYYQDPSSHEDPMQWKKTSIGQLVQDGKYGGSDEKLARLANVMATFAATHPDMARADTIVGVPSHSRRRFSERLADAIGQQLSRPVVRVADDIAAPIKETTPAQRPQPTFQMTDSVRGTRVLIVDDLVRGGMTVDSLARFLAEAGAASISVLAAVRTMRN